MNIEPCVRLGMRISPKIRENPADSRNSRPPNVTLLTVSSTQNVISADLQFCRPDGAKRNPGISPTPVPDFASLHPGYVSKSPHLNPPSQAGEEREGAQHFAS